MTKCTESSEGPLRLLGSKQNKQGQPEEIGLVQSAEEKVKRRANCRFHHLMQQGVRKIERLFLETEEKEKEEEEEAKSTCCNMGNSD